MKFSFYTYLGARVLKAVSGNTFDVNMSQYALLVGTGWLCCRLRVSVPHGG